MQPSAKSALALTFFLIASAVTAVTGSQFQPGDWYRQLEKPLWTPPNAAFPIAWTFLYILMAVAIWVVWREGGLQRNRSTIALHILQLCSNAAWSWLVFGLHELRAGLLNLTFLWAAVATLMFACWRVRPLAGALQVPYLLWLSYAWALNFAMWNLNAV